jgi:two-component system response regulator PilR (NtrC family)
MAAEALAVLDRERVDLLLSDISDGGHQRASTSCARRRRRNRDIVAFMMTAFASTETAVEAMRLGAVDYFTKPFSMDELALKVRQHVEASRLKQENVLLKRA